MKNRKAITWTLILIALVCWINPFKITDPENPGFDPDEFEFSDYDMDRREMAHVFENLFPIGTDKEFVDKILVDQAGATPVPLKVSGTDYTSVRYEENFNEVKQRAIDVLKAVFFNPNRNPFHVFVFDPDGKVVNIRPYHNGYLYKDQPTSSDFPPKRTKD